MVIIMVIYIHKKKDITNYGENVFNHKQYANNLFLTVLY